MRRSCCTAWATPTRTRGVRRRPCKLTSNALAIERQSDNRGREALNLRDIGSALQALGRNEEAAAAYQEAATAFRAADDPMGENGALNNLGQLYATLGRTQEAEQLLDSVVARAGRPGTGTAKRPRSATSVRYTARVVSMTVRWPLRETRFPSLRRSATGRTKRSFSTTWG